MKGYWHITDRPTESHCNIIDLFEQATAEDDTAPFSHSLTYGKELASNRGSSSRLRVMKDFIFVTQTYVRYL